MSVFLQAARREPTPYTPIWLMRQAGRYQPEYRAIREKVTFLELCRRSDLAAEVTVMAAEQLGVDAAIIFADILLILEPLGVPFGFDGGDGPKIHAPIRTAAEIERLSSDVAPRESLGYVMESIRLAKRDLKVPLIGFAGAPFTLASYAVEGGGSKNYFEAKKLMLADEGAWNALMSKLSKAIGEYLVAQIDAGADAVQVFDSWIGCLSPGDYRRYVLPHMKALFATVGNRVPVIHFGTGNPMLYPAFAEAGGDVIGVDWRVSLRDAWAAFPDRGIMGNLDPAALLAPRDVLLSRASEVLADAGGKPGHIFNLGHGIMPGAKVDDVRALVDHVREKSAR